MRTVKILLSLLVIGVAASTASAATLIPGGGWSQFQFGSTGSPLIDAGTGDASYDFTLSGPATLNVTDAYLIGDIFTISDGGSVLFTTSAPGNPAAPTTSDPNVAFTDPNYSHGSITLAAGAHSITGVVTASPYSSGGAFIELATTTTTTVPEPAAWSLMIGGFALVGAAARRRRNYAAA